MTALEKSWTDRGTVPPRQKRAMTFGQIANTFILFAGMVLTALLLAEQETNLDRYRTLFTIRVANVLVIPAFCFFLFRDRNAVANNYWLLFWTFSYAAFMIHFYWAIYVIFHGEYREVIQKTGWRIAGPNFLLTGWWGLDVILGWGSWIAKRDPKILRWERWSIHLYAFVVFAYTDFFLKNGFVRVTGVVLAVSTGTCVVAWLIDRLREHGTAPEQSSALRTAPTDADSPT